MEMQHRIYSVWVEDKQFDENGMAAIEELDELSQQGWEVVGVNFQRQASNMGTKRQKWGWTAVALIRRAVQTDTGPQHAGIRPMRGRRQTP
jgi:hypothetical protein